MAPSVQAHRRSHSLLLLQKLLNLRDSASPLTLICDTLEQSAGPLVREFISRAKVSFPPGAGYSVSWHRTYPSHPPHPCLILIAQNN